jgi:hypothetical protein
MFNQLSKSHQDKISAWISSFPDLKGTKDNLKWVKQKKEEIAQHIRNKYTNKNSLKSHLVALSQTLKLLKDMKGYKLYSDQATSLNKEVVKEYKDQKLDPKRRDNFVCFEDIIKRRDELGKLWENDKANNKANLLYLILSLYTYQPPLRQDWKDVRISKKKPPVRTKKNYLWKREGKYVLYLNHDKVTFSHGKAQLELADPLTKIIDESLDAFPREYVLSLITDGKKQMGKTNFERLLNEIFAPRKVSVDLLRSAYIVHAYNNKNFTQNDKEELAKKMRHSASIAAISYHKLDVDCNSSSLPIKQLPEVEKVEVPPPEPKKYFNLKEYMKEYRLKNKDKIAEKKKQYYEENKDDVLRKKILWNLNVARTTERPSQASIDKYDIQYDDNLKRWV